MRVSVWSRLGSLESTQWDTDLTGAKAGLVLIAFFRPSGQCASRVPGLSRAGKSGDQAAAAAAAVLRMVRPQVSLTVFPEFPSVWRRHGERSSRGLWPVLKVLLWFPGPTAPSGTGSCLLRSRTLFPPSFSPSTTPLPTRAPPRALGTHQAGNIPEQQKLVIAGFCRRVRVPVSGLY